MIEGLNAISKRIDEISKYSIELNKKVLFSIRVFKKNKRLLWLSKSDKNRLSMIVMLADTLGKCLSAPILNNKGKTSTESDKTVKNSIKIIEEVDKNK